jgi:hypothetical protein
MPKSLNWRFLYETKIEKRSEYLSFIDKMNFKTEKTNKSNCTICSENNDRHQMQASRLTQQNPSHSHSNTNKSDVLKYKACHCLKTNDYIFYMLEND